MEEVLINKAINFAKEKHRNQIDDSGKDVFESHLQVVANIIRQITSDPEIIAAAYLHDVIEDTPVTYEDLVQHFGKRVANLVHEVTQEGQKDQYGYYFPRLKSVEAIWIKYADRLSNLTRLSPWPKQRQENYIKKSVFWKKEKKK